MTWKLCFLYLVRIHEVVRRKHTDRGLILRVHRDLEGSWRFCSGLKLLLSFLYLRCTKLSEFRVFVMSVVSESSGRRSSSHRNLRMTRNLPRGRAGSADASASFIPHFSAAASEVGLF